MGIPEVDLDAPITIGACDNGTLYDRAKFDALMADPGTDIIVWAKRGYPGAAKKPEGYGWLEAEGDVVKRASVKVPLSNPSKDPIIIGAFTFKKASDFVRAAEHLIESGVRVNGEIYVDSLINDAIQLGMNVKMMEIDFYLCWGTPNDLRTFNYWQSCFHKWEAHPYQLENDSRIPEGQVASLRAQYRALPAKRPAARRTARQPVSDPRLKVGNC
jgi:hypothetical protein